jgi:hypothetical protein
MISCDCGRKYVSQAKLDAHLVKVPHVVETVAPSTFVTLRFTRPIEVYINSVAFVGDTVKAPNVQIASEIVRIAREAYGREILKI